MPESFNFLKKNTLFCKAKSRKPLTQLTPRKLKWSKSSKRNSTWCPNPLRLLSQLSWRTTLWMKIVRLNKHWNSVKVWRRKSQYWDKRTIFSARSRNWWVLLHFRTSNFRTWKWSTMTENYCGPMWASSSLFKNHCKSRTLETSTLNKSIDK